MIYEQLVERTSRLIDVQLAERRKQLPMEIQKIQREAAASGNLESGRKVLQVRELCAHEIGLRATIVWQNLVRVHKIMGAGLTDSLTDDLKEFIGARVKEDYAELTRILSQNLTRSINIGQVSLDETMEHAINKHDIEVDLYIDSLRQQPQGEENRDEQVSNYNFYGNVGAVQTGDSASANIVQNLGQDDKDALVQALQLARDALLAAQEMNESRKQDLINIVDEVSTELQTASPNSTKIQTLFQTVAISIQTIASAGPAYQALKSALVPIGIMLP